MSNPSFSNIDRWLFELNEGNLSPEQIQQLDVFLLQHPELDVDKDMWELARVEKTEVVFPDQDKFVKRKPVGLYMMAGFVSITVFVIIGIDILTSTSTHLVAAQSNFVSKNDLANQNGKVSPYSIPGGSQKSKDVNVEFDADSSTIFSSDKDYLVPTGFSNFESKNSVNVYRERNSNLNVRHDLNTTYGGLENTHSIDRALFPEDLIAVRCLNQLPIKELEIAVYRNWSEAKSNNSSVRASSADHSASFSSRINKATRVLSRMMDNPIALKNLKDPSFLLPGMLPTDVNFGNTGTIPATRIQILSRLQWPNKENQQMINQMAFDSYVYAIRGGIGVQMNHAYYGTGEIMNSNLALTYSPKISVNRNILIEPSVRFKMGNKTLNSDKIDGFGLAEMDRENVQQFYPTGTVPIGQQLWYRDLGLGMMVNTKWFFIGLQGDNLFKHYDNIYSGDQAASRRVDQHFIATIGTDYESKRELVGLSPYFVYQQSENLKELWMGVNTRLNWFIMGLAVSDRLDGVASVGIKFEQFAFNYQADITHSALWDKQLLSHQINIKFTTFNSNKKQKFLNL